MDVKFLRRSKEKERRDRIINEIFREELEFVNRIRRETRAVVWSCKENG
jgi:hypothetical protein